jgi:D-alanine--poly(phosphoribitol) ligase subunit 2
MEQEIILILNEICGAEPGELEPDMDLFDNGLLDSFGVVQLLVKLEERFGLEVDVERFSRAELATPALIAGIVEKLL